MINTMINMYKNNKCFFFMSQIFSTLPTNSVIRCILSTRIGSLSQDLNNLRGNYLCLLFASSFSGVSRTYRKKLCHT